LNFSSVLRPAAVVRAFGADFLLELLEDEADFDDEDFEEADFDDEDFEDADIAGVVFVVVVVEVVVVFPAVPALDPLVLDCFIYHFLL
jgi:hypothetical protein